MSKKQLHVAIFCDDFYPASGGIGRSIQTQVNELVKLGHKVTLFVPKHYLDKPDNCQIEVVPSFYIPKTPSHMCILLHGRKLAQKYAKKYQFDAVHSQTERGGLMLAARIAKLQQIPHIHTFHANLAGTHASQPFGAFWGSLAYFLLVNPVIATISPKRFSKNVRFAPKTTDGNSFLARFDWHSLATIASRVDAFTAPAQFMIDRICDCAEDLSDRGFVIPTGINRQLAQELQNLVVNRSQDKLRFLSICRLAPEKRVDEIIRAFKIANIPKSQLDIVGTGNQLKQLKLLAENDHRIVFHGQANSIEDVAKHYMSADVFVLASHNFDTQAITITEAVYAGLPIIYCDSRLSVGVDNSNSILTTDNLATSLAEAMKKISNNSLRQAMTISSKKLSKSLSTDCMAQKYITLYRQTKSPLAR